MTSIELHQYRLPADQHSPASHYLLLTGPLSQTNALETAATTLTTQLGDTVHHVETVPATDGWRLKIRLLLTGELPIPIETLRALLDLTPQPSAQVTTER